MVSTTRVCGSRLRRPDGRHRASRSDLAAAAQAADPALYASAPALNGPQRYEFTADGLAISNAGVQNLVRWSAFVEAAETSEFFLLYYAKNCAYYLPRRIMGTEEQVDAVRRLLRERLGDRATHVAPPT